MKYVFEAEGKSPIITESREHAVELARVATHWWGYKLARVEHTREEIRWDVSYTSIDGFVYGYENASRETLAEVTKNHRQPKYRLHIRGRRPYPWEITEQG